MKKVVLISSVLVTILFGTYFYFSLDNDKYVLKSENNSEKIVNTNALTMMLETEYESGEYQVASDTTWPQEGYTFNETLSKCENGSTLTWDDENKIVLMQTNTSDRCYVYFDKEPDIVYLADYIINNVYVEDGVNGLYYHDGVGTYTNADQEAGDNSYRYSGGEYQLTSKAISLGYTNIFTVSSESNGVINFYCSGQKEYLETHCESNLSRYYTTAFDESFNYYTLNETLNEAINSGYLTYKNLNNYICFGSDVNVCPEDNLYRIIGIFGGQLKLIKATSIGNYTWDHGVVDFDNIQISLKKNNKTVKNMIKVKKSGILAMPDPRPSGASNVWDTADLNVYINGDEFFNKFDMIWQNRISINDWKVGKILSTNIQNNIIKESYQYELGLKSCSEEFTGCIYKSKIGLMYVSDYGYAASPENWNSQLSKYNNLLNIENNWMYLGDFEWTISAISDYDTGAFSIDRMGNLENELVYSAGPDISYLSVRPTFYLNSDVVYISGDGSINNPYRIA